MRHVIIVVDGGSVGGDLWPSLERAATPAIDRLGALGRVGAAALTPGRVSLGTGLLTLLGYEDLAIAGVSSAVLASFSAGAGLTEADVALSIDLVGIAGEDDEGVMLGVAPLSDHESDLLFDDLMAHWREVLPDEARRLHVAGRGPRRVLLERDGPGCARVETVDPTEIVGEPWVDHLPDGGQPGAAERLCALISASRHHLEGHTVNLTRHEQGLTPAGLAWVWGPGTAAGVGGHAGRVGPGLLVLADSDEAIGVATLVGAEARRLGEVETLAARVLSLSEPIVLAVVSCDLERVDREIVAPMLAGLESSGGRLESGEAGWRLMVVVSHDVGGGLTPFVLGGGWVRGLVPRRLHEALESDLHVDPGCELFEYALRAGLRGA